jgi:hypothetical protein
MTGLGVVPEDIEPGEQEGKDAASNHVGSTQNRTLEHLDKAKGRNLTSVSVYAPLL